MFSKFNVSPYLAKGTVSFRFYQSPSSFYWQPCLGLNKWRPSKIHWSFCDGQTMRRTKFTSLLKSERRLQSNVTQHIYCTYITFLHFGFTRVAVQLISPRKEKIKKEHLRKYSNLSTTATYFDPSQKICFYFNLSTTATPSQWSVHSDPRVAFVNRLHLGEERADFFGSSLKQTRLIIRHE